MKNKYNIATAAILTLLQNENPVIFKNFVDYFKFDYIHAYRVLRTMEQEGLIIFEIKGVKRKQTLTFENTEKLTLMFNDKIRL